MREYLLGLYEKSMPNDLSLPEKLRETKAAGFDYLELSVDETAEKLARLDWDDEMIHALNQAQAQTGIPIKSMCLSGHRKFPLGSEQEEIVVASLEIMEKAVILASKLGIRIIQLAGYDTYYDEGNSRTRAIFGENLKKATAMAAKEGIMLGFETMETPFMNTVGKAMEWVREIYSPYLQVYPDVGNLTNASLLHEEDVVVDLEKGAGHLVAVHLKETVPGAYREIPYGTGHVDFARVVQAAWDLGVRMFVGEFWYTGESNWREINHENNLFLRSFF